MSQSDFVETIRAGALVISLCFPRRVLFCPAVCIANRALGDLRIQGQDFASILVDLSSLKPRNILALIQEYVGHTSDYDLGGFTFQVAQLVP